MTCLCIIIVLTCVGDSWFDLPNLPQDESGDFNF